MIKKLFRSAVEAFEGFPSARSMLDAVFAVPSGSALGEFTCSAIGRQAAIDKQSMPTARAFTNLCEGPKSIQK